MVLKGVRHAVLLDDLDGLEGGAAGAQEGAALGEDAGEIVVGQQAEAAVDQALIAVQEAVHFHLFLGVEQGLRDAAHGRVQGLAIAAGGQHTDANHGDTSFFEFYALVKTETLL